LRRRLEPEDLAQDVLHELYERLPSFEPRTLAEFRSWLRTLVQHRINDWSDRISAAKRDPRLAQTLDSQIASLRTSPSGAAMRHEFQELVRRAVRELRPQDAEVLRLRFLENLCVREAAERLGINEGNVKIRTMRAKQALEEWFHAKARKGGRPQ
jgi:RNA polymerase sigma-70 factor (ECF subfamily)